MSLIKPRHLLLLLAVVLAGALTVMVVQRYRPPVEVAEVVKALPSGVDVALQDIDYTHSEAGVSRWRLVAKQVQHQSAEKMTSLQDLALTFYDVHGVEQGMLTAQTGQVPADFSMVEVQGSVKMVSRNGYTLQTDHLSYHQQDRIVRTDAPVTLTSEGLQLEGVGLQLNVATQRLQILQKVHVVLESKRMRREKS